MVARDAVRAGPDLKRSPPERVQNRSGSAAVVLSLQGGLGNQLFQWAFGMALRNRGFDVRVDTVRCGGERPLAIAPLISEWPHVPRAAGLALRVAHRGDVLGRVGPQPVLEKGFGYDDGLVERLSSVRTSYLLGYFQSPRYFEEVAPQVRKNLSAFVSESLTSRGSRLLSTLAARERTVAIHIRRGDYLNSRTAAHHGLLSLRYYEQALKYLDREGARHRVWFSDDLDWVRANIARPGDTVCDGSLASRPAGELALMAACNARVVANSSFSWWGAWLGQPSTVQHPVVAPARWLAAAPGMTGDVVPESWVLL